MKFGTIDLKQLRGLVDKFLGLQKEILGTFIGNDNLADEGRAQQDKGSANLKALKAEAKAEAAKAKASTKGTQQRAAQRAKQRTA